MNFANICIVTHNRIRYTRETIHALLQHTDLPFVLTLVDNSSHDGTQEYLHELHRNGIVKNLILFDENIGVARASNAAWQQEPGARYYIKLDNDIVIRKAGWLGDMIRVVESIPTIGILGYNFEPVSYPVVEMEGMKVRPKVVGNLGGACVLIPKWTENILGYWCEDYGLYGEEDADYGFRVTLAGLRNVYMEDENMGTHLPDSGRTPDEHDAALSPDPSDQSARTECERWHREYRQWKDARRLENLRLNGAFQRNVDAYKSGAKALRVLPADWCL